MHTTRQALILVSLVFSSALTGVVLGLKHDRVLATTPPSGQWFDYVVNIMLENHSINFTYYSGGSVNSCLGNCTYFTSLANSNGLALGLTDGSINASTASYIAITSGYGNAAQSCNSGPNATGCPYLKILNIVDRLENAGLTWKAYMEGYPQPPSGCFTNYNSSPPFYYTPNHNPFLYYADIVNNTARCARIVAANSQPVTQNSTGCWPSALQNDDVLIKDLNSVTNASNYMWLTPNTLDQTHDCNDVSLGNAWLNKLIPQILGSTLFKTKRAALFVTFDEPGCTNPSGQPSCPSSPPPSQNVYSVWASNPSNPTTRGGFKSTQSYLLYSPLKAVESNWGLPTLTANDASANNMAEFFAVLSASFTYSPSLIQPGQQVTFTASATGGAAPYSYSWRFGDGATATGNPAAHTYGNAGTYNTQLTITDKLGITKNVTQTIMVGPSFTVSSSPSSLTLHTGSSNTSKIILASINNFSGAVSLTTSVSSSGLTASLNVTSISLVPGRNASSTLTVSSANSGTYSVNVTGTSGSNTHTTTIIARVVTADFGITASPTSLTIPPSTIGILTIQLASLNQFSGIVSLSSLISPSGLLPSLTPPALSLSSGGSSTSTLSVSSLNYGNYTVMVTGVAGSLSHSTTLTVRVFPSSVVVASDSTSGTTSLYTTGGQKPIQDSAGKIIAVYVDSSGRISLTYDNTDPSQGGWSTPVKSPTPSSAYSWPAAVLVSLTSLRIITVGGSVPGAVVDIPVTISRGSGNNVTGFSFGTPTMLDSSGLGKYTAATLLHNNDILAAWGWENTTTSILKSLRWDPTTGWTSLSGSSNNPDNVLVDKSVVQYFVPNMIERLDNHNVYLFASRFVSSGRIAFSKASWSGSGWSWGAPNLTYETNASDADDDAIGLSWDPGRSLVVAEYGISGTHTYGVFTLTSADIKTHIDTPSLAVTGDRGWGAIGVQTNTGDYYLFLISVGSDAGSGALGYIRMISGGAWNSTITWLNTATDNQVTSLRTTGPNSSLDLLYVEGVSTPASVKFVRLGAPSFSIAPDPASLSVQVSSTGTSTIAVSSLYNFAGTVNLSATVSSPGTAATLVPATITLTSGGVAISTLSLNPTTTGIYTVTILGTNGLLSISTTITVTATDFSVAASPTSITVAAGDQGTSTITATALNGFTGTVSLSVSASVPTGLTCAVPSSITFGTSPQTATLRCSAATAGDYTITVTGGSGTLGHTTPTVLFHVVDFSISAGSISPAQILVGSSGASPITLGALNGLTGTVNLAVSASAPAGLTCTLPASVNFGTSPQTATLSCSAAIAGTYAVTVTGTDGTLSHTSATLTVTVVDFTVNAGTVSPPQILAGASGTSTVTITPINGFTGTVNLSVTASTPAGLICTIPSTVSFGISPQNATISCSSTTPSVYTLYVTGTDGTMSHMTAAIAFAVVDFAISPGAVSPAQVLPGASATSTLTLTSLNGFASTISLTTNSTSCTLGPAILPGPGTSLLSCAFTSAGTTSVAVTGTSGSLSHSAIVIFTVQDFTITSPASIATLLAGSTGSSTVIVTSLNGFSGPVNLATNSTSCVMAPVSSTSPGSSTISCAFTSASTIHIAVTGVSGARSQTTMLTFVVQDYTMSANPTSIVADIGISADSSVAINGLNGFAGVVSLTTNSTSCTVTPSSLTGAGSADLSCRFTNAGSYSVGVIGTSNGLSHVVAATYLIQDFSFGASQSPVAISAGGTGTSNLSITSLDGFNGLVLLATNSTSCSISPSILIGAGNATLSCIFATAGTIQAAVVATSGPISHTSVVTFNVQDFGISANPTTVFTNVGAASMSIVTISSVTGFSSIVGLTTNSTACTISPATLTGSGTTNLSCNFASVSTTRVTVTAGSGTLSHSTIVTYVVQDFTIGAVTQGPANVNGTLVSTISANGLNQFSGTIRLSDIVPTGLTCSFLTPPTLVGSGTAMVSCTAPTPANYTLTIMATSANLVHETNVTISFQDYTITASQPAIATVFSPAASTITIQAENGFSSAIGLSDTPQSGLNCNGITPGSITGSGQATVSCSSAVAGNYTLTITTNSTTLTHNVTVTLIFGDYSIEVSAPPARSVGQTAISTIRVVSINHFVGTVFLSDSLPTGLSCLTISPISLTGSGIANVSCAASSVGNYALQVVGTAGSLSRNSSMTFQISDFKLSTTPSPITSFVGGNATFTITVTSLNGYSGTVQATVLVQNVPSMTGTGGFGGGSGRVIYLASLPPSPDFVVNPGSQPLGSGGIAIFTVAVTFPLGIQPGNYTLIVVVTDGQLSRTAKATVAVTDFGLSSPTNILSITRGNNATMVLSVHSINGFKGMLNLSSTFNPAGPTGSLSPSSFLLVNGANITLTINVQSNVQPGNYTLTIQATTGTLSHAVFITVQVSSQPVGAFARVSSGETATAGVAGLLTLILALPHSRRDGHSSRRRRMRPYTNKSGCLSTSRTSAAGPRVVVISTWLPYPIER